MNITILAIGKIKEKYFADAIFEYIKRLSPYVIINIKELKAISFTDKNKEKAKKEEGVLILNYLNKLSGKTIIALDEHGENFPSEEFSRFLCGLNSQVIFVIGGSLGLDEKVIKKSNKLISLSKMTFPHELARLVLCEQIYRAVAINKNKTYHY